MGANPLEAAFGGVLLAFVTSLLALRRVRRRRAVVAWALVPFAAWLGYERAVAKVMPHADIRVDWLLLLPIALLHVRARWRHLE